MKLEFEPTITKQYLLDRASQETYLEYYLGIPVKKGLFKSPLRADNNPTCSFYRNKSGDIILKDFSGAFYGNFINVVMYKFGLTYYRALKQIATDFGYIKSPKYKKNPKPVVISTNEFKESKEANIQVEIQDFSKEELDWWMQFGITEEILKKFRVFSCKTVFLNGNFFTSATKNCPIFGYYRGKNENETELWRIYFPFHKKHELRFLSNWKSFLLQGSKQLPKEGELLDFASEIGIVEKSGAWYAYKGNKIGQGKENVKLLLKDNKDLASELETQIREYYGIANNKSSKDSVK